MTEQDLIARLRRIDGRGYKAYKEIQGSYQFPDFELRIDHVQGDPFAAPSRVRVFLDAEVANFPADLYANRARQTGLENLLLRAFAAATRGLGPGSKGSGKSGQVEADRPGQEVLRRSALMVDQGHLEVRFTVGLPARGRSVLGRQAIKLLTEAVPDLIEQSLLYDNLDAEKLRRCVEAVEDQQALRAALASKGLVSFLAEGAVLPRRSGVDPRPLQEGALPLQTPDSLRVSFDLPNAGQVTGMGIPEGITLIVGGGFHGKSTLLEAVSHGVYDHFPQDGREQVVTIDSAVKVRAEDGRRVEKVDITPFINNLPLGKDTRRFCTDNASGSTSQAASILEALEVGASCLLIDEDISATNFMIRDARMQELVSSEHEPITPLIDRIHELYQQRGVSTILVMGGSGDYFEVAHRVLKMQAYQPAEVSEQAAAIRQRYPNQRKPLQQGPAQWNWSRRARARSLDASRGKRSAKIEVRDRDQLLFGQHRVDLSGLEQLVSSSQTRAIGWLLHHFGQKLGKAPLEQELPALIERLEQEGLDLVCPHPMGNLAFPRVFELAGALNRLRTLVIE